MKTDKIEDVFCTLLCDIRAAEEQLREKLPEIVEKTKNPDLAAALEKMSKQTTEQLERIDSVHKTTNTARKSRACQAMDGYLNELDIMMGGAEEGPLRDIGIVAYGKKIGHYMIASYEVLANLAEGMGNNEAAQKLKLNLKQVEDAEGEICALGRKSVGPDVMRKAA